MDSAVRHLASLPTETIDGENMTAHRIVSQRLCFLQRALKIIGFLSFLAIAAACAKENSSIEPGQISDNDSEGLSSPHNTSIITLLAGRHDLEGEVVQVEGYLAADWEGPIVFLTHDHCQTYSSYDGVGLILGTDFSVDWSHFREPDCRRVVVEGTYEFWGSTRPDPAAISFRIVQAVLRDVSVLTDITND